VALSHLVNVGGVGGGGLVVHDPSSDNELPLLVLHLGAKIVSHSISGSGIRPPTMEKILLNVDEATIGVLGQCIDSGSNNIMNRSGVVTTGSLQPSHIIVRVGNHIDIQKGVALSSSEASNAKQNL
jgi:hypothetical protein